MEKSAAIIKKEDRFSETCVQYIGILPLRFSISGDKSVEAERTKKASSRTQSHSVKPKRVELRGAYQCFPYERLRAVRAMLALRGTEFRPILQLASAPASGPKRN